MKKFNRFLALFLIIITLLLCALGVLVGCQDTEADNRLPEVTELTLPDYKGTSLAVPELATSLYYGRAALASLPNSTALLYAYDKINEGVKNSEAEISIYNGTNSITIEELDIVVDVYRRDHPEVFWLDNSQYSRSPLKYIPTYYISGTELEEAKAEFEQAVVAMLSGITSEMSDYEKELYIHDKLAAKVSYIESTNAHNAYGALVEGEAVCEGYAEAFQYLLQRVGIQAFTILGTSVNPSTEQSEGHAWNAVKIDGKFYQVDLTWNDQDSYLYHAYFNITDTAIQKDHEITATAYALPVCNSDDANYFKKTGRYLTSYNVNEIATLLKNNGYSVSVYPPNGDTAVFKAWIKDNINSIAYAAGISSGEHPFYQTVLGSEVLLTVDVCNHTSKTFTASEAATCTKSGNIAYYTCNACGKMFTDAALSAEIFNIYATKTDPIPHTYTEKLQDSEHLKYAARHCLELNTYWYDCKDCTANAKNDTTAQDKWYEGTVAGAHDYDVTRLGFKNELGHAHKCKTAGCDAYDTVIPHISSGSATETEPEICTLCSYIITPAFNHTSHTPSEGWESNSKYHWHRCTGCEGQEFDKAEHTYTNDCDDTCDICLEAHRQAGHTFSEDLKSDRDNHWYECTCGERDGVIPHIDENKDGKCDECGTLTDAALSPLGKFIKDALILTVIVTSIACGAAIILAVVIKSFKRKWGTKE